MMKSKTVLPNRENLQDERFVTITRFAYIYGAMGHFIIGMTCYLLKIQELMWFNFLFSVPVFIAAYGLNRKGLINLAFFVAMVELLLHQVFAVYLLGWQSGAQYYLIYLAGLSFFNPKRKNGDLFDPLMTVTLANPGFFIRSTVDQDKNYLRPRSKRLADSG